jgi:hypothetical protein
MKDKTRHIVIFILFFLVTFADIWLLTVLDMRMYWWIAAFVGALWLVDTGMYMAWLFNVP